MACLFAAANFSQTWVTTKPDEPTSTKFIWTRLSGSGCGALLPYAQRFAFDSAKCIDSMGDTSGFHGRICSQDSDCGPWSIVRSILSAARNEMQYRRQLQQNRQRLATLSRA
jgi:hypothetical protein